MTQVLQHDYGKSKITLLQIRAAIKAVRAEKSAHGGAQPKQIDLKKTTHRPAPAKSSK